MIEHICPDCGWWGTRDELVPDEENGELCPCPGCGGEPYKVATDPNEQLYEM